MALTKIKTGGIADNAITDAKVADNITAGTAATLATARNINGVSFNGSSAITVTAAAGTLTGATLASGVTASSLTSVGTLTTLTVDDITINGSTISDSGDLTLDIGADIILDAGGNEIKLKTGGTEWGEIYKSSSDLAIYSSLQDKDIKFQGNDGGSVVTALTLDMSEGGLVGVGTSSPSSYDSYYNNLVVYEDGNAGIAIIGNTSSETSLGFGDGTSAATYRGAVAYVHTSGSHQDKMFFKTAATNQMVIDSSGKLGVGTIIPDSLIHAKVTTNTSETIRIQNDDSLTTVGVSSDGYSFHTYQHSLYWASWDGSTWSTKARLDNDGNWGIGDTSPSTALTSFGSASRGLSIKNQQPTISFTDSDVTKRAHIGFDGGNENFIISSPESSGIITLQTGGFTERMRILSDGRISIKATSLPQDFGGERGQVLISSVDNAGANNYAVLQLQGHSVANSVAIGGIYFYDHSSNNAIIQAQRQNNSGSAKLSFYTSESGGSAQERMTIYDAGAVVMRGSVSVGEQNQAGTRTLTINTDVWSNPELNFYPYGNYQFKLLNAGSSSPKRFKLTNNASETIFETGGNNSKDMWFGGDVSAASFTDRTPYPETLQIAYDVLASHKKLDDYDKNDKEHQLDHTKLHDFAKPQITVSTGTPDNEKITKELGQDGRDASAVISCLVEVVNDLTSKVTALENA